MLNQEQINQLLEDAKPDIVNSLKKAVMEDLTREVNRNCVEVFKNHINSWLKENILPEITKTLIESKEGLIKVGVQVTTEINDMLAKSMVAHIKERLEKEWTRGEIFKALLGR